jgi:hypothetical protein
MSDEHEQPKQRDTERMELRHDAVPGYRPVFYVACAVGIVYLVIVFIFFAGGAH